MWSFRRNGSKSDSTAKPVLQVQELIEAMEHVDKFEDDGKITYVEDALRRDATLRDRLPVEWGRMHLELGLSYWQRVRGHKIDNLRRVKEHLSLALTVSYCKL